MKTITEFSGFVLKEAISKKAALLAEGKSEEEAQGAINEQLKLADETKIAFYKNAVDMSNSRLDRVKRVVVATKGSETEKVPEAFTEREGHFYLIEFFPSSDSRGRPGAGRDDDFRGGDRGRGGRGGGGRGSDRGGDRGRGPGRGNERGGGGGYGGGDRDRAPREFSSDRGAGGGDRPARAPYPARDPSLPRPTGTFAKLDPNAVPAPRPARPPRERKPAAPRAQEPRAPRGPKGAGELRLVLKGQSTTLQGSGPAEAPASVNAAPEASTETSAQS